VFPKECGVCPGERGVHHAGRTVAATLLAVVASLAAVPALAQSEAVTSTGGIPEPASWALMLIGAAGVGALTRRRRSRGRSGAARLG